VYAVYYHHHHHRRRRFNQEIAQRRK